MNATPEPRRPAPPLWPDVLLYLALLASWLFLAPVLYPNYYTRQQGSNRAVVEFVYGKM